MIRKLENRPEKKSIGVQNIKIKYGRDVKTNKQKPEQSENV